MPAAYRADRTGVTVRFGEDVDHHVEEHDVGARPPGDGGAGVDRQCGDGGVGVLASAVVVGEDLGAGLVFGDPEVVVVRVAGVGEARERVGVRPIEDLAEVARLRDRQVLDQAEQIRAGVGERPAYVVLGQPVDFRHEPFTYPTKSVVQIGLREVVDHTANTHPTRGPASEESLVHGAAARGDLYTAAPPARHGAT